MRGFIAGAVFAAAASLVPAPCQAQGYIISTVAGGNPFITSIGDGGPAVSAFLNSPTGVAVDSSGNFYIADAGNHLIRKVSAIGTISSIAGNRSQGYTGDGGPATSAQLHGPTAVAFDAAGNLYIADTGNNRVRKVDTHGIITTVAGSSTVFSSGVGDGGPAIGANLTSPRGLAVDSSGNLYIADYGNRLVRKVDSTGTITTFAGNGFTGTAGNIGDGGAATSANVTPVGLAFDSSGNLFVADAGNNVVRKISKGNISSVAGTGTNGYLGDTAVATSAQLNQPQGVAVDGSGNIFIADTGNQVIREVTPSNGKINTIAGSGGLVGNTGDGGPAGAATLDTPVGIALSASGVLYIANDSSGYKDARVRALIPASGTVPTINTNGVVPVFNTTTAITPGSWISIYGTGFSSTTAVWNNDFPTALGQVSVTIDSKPAYLWFVSPTQINCQVPDDTFLGTVNVAVSTPGGTATTTVTLNTYGPSFSLLNATYPAAIVVTPGSLGNSGKGYDIIGPPGAFPYITRPVAAGETLVLFGVGFGPTVPAVPSGRPFSGPAAPLATLPSISIGDIPAVVTFGGLVEAGLYQFNVIVPNAGSGDQTLESTTSGYSTQPNILITLK